MALYSFSIKPITRKKRGSAMKAAAYQSRERLYGEREDVQYDFTHKTDLLHAEICLPANAPPEFSDRQTLWNAVEAAEGRIDSRVGRAVI